MTKELKEELMNFINDVSLLQSEWCDVDLESDESRWDFEDKLVDLRRRAWDLKDVIVLADPDELTELRSAIHDARVIYNDTTDSIEITAVKMYNRLKNIALS